MTELARGTLSSGDLSAGLAGDIGLASVRVWIATLVYICLAATLTMLGRNTALGISVGLAVLFLEGLAVPVVDLLGDSFAWTKDILMNWNVQGILAANGYVPGVNLRARLGCAGCLAGCHRAAPLCRCLHRLDTAHLPAPRHHRIAWSFSRTKGKSRAVACVRYNELEHWRCMTLGGVVYCRYDRFRQLDTSDIHSHVSDPLAAPVP